MFYSHVSSCLFSQDKAEAGCTIVTLFDPELLEIGGLGKVTPLSSDPPTQSQPVSVFTCDFSQFSVMRPCGQKTSSKSDKLSFHQVK